MACRAAASVETVSSTFRATVMPIKVKLADAADNAAENPSSCAWVIVITMAPVSLRL